jgi:hypothetical protein
VSGNGKNCGFPDFFCVNELAELKMSRAGSVLCTYGFLWLETKLEGEQADTAVLVLSLSPYIVCLE